MMLKDERRVEKNDLRFATYNQEGIMGARTLFARHCLHIFTRINSLITTGTLRSRYYLSSSHCIEGETGPPSNYCRATYLRNERSWTFTTWENVASGAKAVPFVVPYRELFLQNNKRKTHGPDMGQKKTCDIRSINTQLTQDKLLNS